MRRLDREKAKVQINKSMKMEEGKSQEGGGKWDKWKVWKKKNKNKNYTKIRSIHGQNRKEVH